MNGAQRKVVSNIIAGLGNINVLLAGYADNVREVAEQLQNKYDDMSEKVQESEKGEELLAHIDALESVCEDLENGLVDSACSALQEI